MPKPGLENVPQFYHAYINLVADADLNETFVQHQITLPALLQNLEPAKWNFQYAEGKWTIKEMVQHIIDTDRIFCYRALCFARKESAALPGFDENNYAVASRAARRNRSDLMEELKTVQRSSAQLFASFDEVDFQSGGISNGNYISVAAIGFSLVGHTLHHVNILKARYL
ncbi:MAG TPA: DinB family protein [Flavisolibacter sp.]|nr:DinB family protein [Flavisolibacter sp.]